MSSKCIDFLYVIKSIIVNECFVICVGLSLLSKTVDVTLTPAKVQKVENEELGSDVASGSGGGGTGVEEPGIVDKKDFRELSETPKLLQKPKDSFSQ